MDTSQMANVESNGVTQTHTLQMLSGMLNHNGDKPGRMVTQLSKSITLKYSKMMELWKKSKLSS
jgi:hypothetical protein